MADALRGCVGLVGYGRDHFEPSGQPGRLRTRDRRLHRQLALPVVDGEFSRLLQQGGGVGVATAGSSEAQGHPAVKAGLEAGDGGAGEHGGGRVGGGIPPPEGEIGDRRIPDEASEPRVKAVLA